MIFRGALKCLLYASRSKGLDPGPTRVVEAVWTCRSTRQHKIGIDLSLERLTPRLADHRQSTLWIDIALKIKSTRGRNSGTRGRSCALEGGNTVANGQILTGDKIGTAGVHVPGDSITVISVKGPGRVRRRSGREAGRGKWWRWLLLHRASRDRDERYPQQKSLFHLVLLERLCRELQVGFTRLMSQVTSAVPAAWFDVGG